ncbi:shematrin-like protein 1 [Topomyia yanbarensis]|uniref:shematrin-like protein 1 n=1 Tax=Topomyia yanbarensis TaxID=2498891 RepID=UPI00273B63B4|nr:shematrin-like protein 1 [Topomyia yanbarensis]
MKVLALFTISAVCLAGAIPLDAVPASSAVAIEPSASRKTEKRGIGLGYGLTGFGYDAPLGYSAIGYHPGGYVAPVSATTTVIKAGYSGIPAAASAGYGGYGYHGFYPGYTTGYSTGYSGLGYGAIPAASGASYAKVVQPATTAYSKVIHTYPHYGSTVGSPALGYSGIGGYHGGYVY